MQKGLTDFAYNTVYCIVDLDPHDVSEDHHSPLFIDANGGLLVNTLTYYPAGLAFCPTLRRC
jgi:hypothetical protein